VQCTDATRPLIVITTNEERELPPAFLRRCLSITLELPKDDMALAAELVALGTQHQEFLVRSGRWPGRCVILNEAAQALVKLRKAAEVGDYQPGTSEYLDLVRALATLHPDDRTRQVEALELLSDFVRKTRCLPT
jgi:MoxR-like ATPase